MITKTKAATILMLFIVISGRSAADSWISPVELKYKNAYPVLYSKYDKAKSLLSDYRGNRDELIEAQTLLDEVISSMKSFAPAYREYGRLIAKAGHTSYGRFQGNALEVSEQLVMESLTIEPDFAEAYVYLGYLYTRMRDYTKARKALEKAEQIGTGLAWLDYNWAELLRHENRDEEAILKYEAVVDSNTDNKAAYSSAMSGLANLYKWNGEYDKAKLWFEKTIQYEPDSAWIWGDYGSFLLFFQGEIDESIEKFEEALSIMDYGVARTHYACALYTKWAALYRTDSNDPEAKILFEKAYELQPDLDVIFRKTYGYPSTRDTADLIEQVRNERALAEIQEMIDENLREIGREDLIR